MERGYTLRPGQYALGSLFHFGDTISLGNDLLSYEMKRDVIYPDGMPRAIERGWYHNGILRAGGYTDIPSPEEYIADISEAGVIFHYVYRDADYLAFGRVFLPGHLSPVRKPYDLDTVRPSDFKIRMRNNVLVSNTTMTGTADLETEEQDDVLIYAPALPYTRVGGLTLPVVYSLTSADVTTKTEVVDPSLPGEVTDVDSLGLPVLGAALTTRFPFSIPRDIFRAVQLLAAPAKAPYFEVDFLEPLADDVGGWRGSTTLILDFSEYAIIGQVCRWTSTIGFCLMLAGATKRLIWTA